MQLECNFKKKIKSQQTLRKLQQNKERLTCIKLSGLLEMTEFKNKYKNIKKHLKDHFTEGNLWGKIPVFMYDRGCMATDVQK